MNENWHKAWTPDDVELLKKEYANMSSVDLSLMLDRSRNSIHMMAHNLGLKKSQEYLRNMHTRHFSDEDRRAAKRRANRKSRRAKTQRDRERDRKNKERLNKRPKCQDTITHHTIMWAPPEKVYKMIDGVINGSIEMRPT